MNTSVFSVIRNHASERGSVHQPHQEVPRGAWIRPAYTRCDGLRHGCAADRDTSTHAGVEWSSDYCVSTHVRREGNGKAADRHRGPRGGWHRRKVADYPLGADRARDGVPAWVARVLILRERGVLDDGILERGIVGLYMPEFDLEQPLDASFASPEWNGIIGKWEFYVRSVVDKKSAPPRLF